MEEFERWFRYPFTGNSPEFDQTSGHRMSEKLQICQLTVRELQEQVAALSNEVSKLRNQIRQIERNYTHESSLSVISTKHHKTLTVPIQESLSQPIIRRCRKKGRM